MGRGLFLAVPKPAIGGGEEHNHQIAKHLVEMGEDVLVVTPQYPGDAEFDRHCVYQVIRIATTGGMSGKGTKWWMPYRRPLYGVSVIRKMLQFKPDYVIVGTASRGLSMLASGIVSRVARIPRFVFVHHDEFTRPTPYGLLTNPIFRSSHLICVSNYTRSLVLDAGIPLRRAHVVLNGVDYDEISSFQNSRQNTSHSQLESIFPGKMILTVCRLVRHKGVDRLIESLPKVFSKIPDAGLVIVGDGTERDRLELIAKNSGVQDRVKFLGRLSDVEKFLCYQRCDLFAMLSRETYGQSREGFGIVFLEANAFGKPTIGGDTGGVPDAIVHRETGLLVDPNSTEEISNAIIYLLENPSEAHKLGENGRHRVQNELNWNTASIQVKEIIDANIDRVPA